LLPYCIAVDAKWQVVHRNIAGAAALYEEAITQIRERRFPLYEGTAFTLAASNATALGMRTAAEHFYADACRVYTAYGATTLVAVLVRQHGCVFPSHIPIGILALSVLVLNQVFAVSFFSRLRVLICCGCFF
jgi:hypothetical protein